LSAFEHTGFQGALPLAFTVSGAVGALGAMAPCSGPRFGRVSIHTFSSDVIARRLPFPTEACDVGGAGTPWLFPIDDDEVGLLYRHAGAHDHEVRYVRLGPDGTPRSTSRIGASSESSPSSPITRIVWSRNRSSTTGRVHN
jgi:hypothetical protein